MTPGSEDFDLPAPPNEVLPNTPAGVGHRTVTSLAWNVVASPLRMAVMFVRSVITAHLLGVATFGVFAMASSIVFVTSSLARSIDGALLNRAPETEDEQRAADVLFSMKTIVTAVWVLALCAWALLGARPALRGAVLTLTGVTAVSIFLDTPRAVLARRVVHRRLVMADLAELTITSLVTVGLALAGAEIWALVGAEIVGVAVSAAFLVGWRPAWRPHWRLDRDVVRYYLRFGSRTAPARVLFMATERIDDLWTGAYLGDYSLGIYSRAYRFATYPRNFVVAPITSVIGGTYAELKHDRQRLNAVFRLSNSVLLTAGLAFGGALVLAAPEMVRLVLGVKWLPMVRPFQLMCIFALVDPIRIGLANMLGSLGDPGSVLRAYTLQFAVLAVGLLLLGPPFGISGVTLAVDGMVVLGTAYLYRRARRHVDVPISRLVAPPLFAAAVGTAATLAVFTVPLSTMSFAVQMAYRFAFIQHPVIAAMVMAVKLSAFGFAYAATLALVDRRTLADLFAAVRPVLDRRR